VGHRAAPQTTMPSRLTPGGHHGYTSSRLFTQTAREAFFDGFGRKPRRINHLMLSFK
jgi:hypothetical protein